MFTHTMARPASLVSLCAFLCLLSGCHGSEPDSTSGLPGEVAINSTPGTQYVQAAAVATMLEKYTPMKAFVDPTKSHVAAMPLFQRNELQFIFVSQAEMYLANRGAEYYQSVGPTPIRVAAAGTELMFTFFTSPRTGIESVEDFAGRKIMWDTKASGVFFWAAKYVLDYYELHDDIVSVPSPRPVDRAEAVKSGRVDAYASSTQYQAMEILVSSVGMKMLAIPSDAAEWVNEKYPPVYPLVCPKGYNGGMVPEDIPVLGASTALHAHADVDDDVVYASLEAIYDHIEEFAGLHPTLSQMTLARAVSLRSIVPYHSGAIRFFKDRGVWTEEAEAMQQRLLEELSASR